MSGVKAEDKYRPLFIFIISMLALGFLGYLILSSYNMKLASEELRKDCVVVCDYNNMTYEGIKNGQCACIPSLGVRVYLENEPYFNVTVNSSLGTSANLRFSPKFAEKYNELNISMSIYPQKE